MFSLEVRIKCCPLVSVTNSIQCITQMYCLGSAFESLAESVCSRCWSPNLGPCTYYENTLPLNCICNPVFCKAMFKKWIFKKFIHMCIHCLGHLRGS
jgi:hypothetical protein